MNKDNPTLADFLEFLIYLLQFAFSFAKEIFVLCILLHYLIQKKAYLVGFDNTAILFLGKQITLHCIS